MQRKLLFFLLFLPSFLFAQSMEIIPQVGHAGPIREFIIDHQGKLGATGSEDRSIKIIDLESGMIFTTLRGHQAPINYLAFSADDQFMVSVETKETESYHGEDIGFANVFIWRTADWSLVNRIELGVVQTMDFALHPVKPQMALHAAPEYGRGGKYGLVDLATGKYIWQKDRELKIGSMCFSPDGSMFAMAGHREGPHVVDIFSAATGELKTS